MTIVTHHALDSGAVMDAGILRELALQITGIHTLVASEADTAQDPIETAKKSLIEETTSSR